MDAIIFAALMIAALVGFTLFDRACEASATRRGYRREAEEARKRAERIERDALKAYAEEIRKARGGDVG